MKRYKDPKEYFRRKPAHGSRLPITTNFRKVFWASMNTRASQESKQQRTARLHRRPWTGKAVPKHMTNMNSFNLPKPMEVGTIISPFYR